MLEQLQGEAGRFSKEIEEMWHYDIMTHDTGAQIQSN